MFDTLTLKWNRSSPSEEVPAFPSSHIPHDACVVSGCESPRPRVAVLGVLDDAQERAEHLLVNDIVVRTLARAGDVAVQTVYDCLDALDHTGVVRRVETAGSPARYQTRVGDNHHHLVCRQCGSIADVDCAAGPAACLLPAQDLDFVVDEAEVSYWGMCSTCTEIQNTEAQNTEAHGTEAQSAPTSRIALRGIHHNREEQQ